MNCNLYRILVHSPLKKNHAQNSDNAFLRNTHSNHLYNTKLCTSLLLLVTRWVTIETRNIDT